jgi:hypothetical protein
LSSQKKIIVWDPDHNYELNLARRLNIDLFDNAEIISGIPTYDIKNDPRKKIVIKDWWFWNGSTGPKLDLNWADLVICYTGEIINGPWERYYEKTINQFNNTNFISISNGKVNLVDFPQDLVYDNIGHFMSKIADVCRFEDWNISKDKPKLFDALLGNAKPHRTFVFNQLQKHGLLDKSFVNIFANIYDSSYGTVNYKSPDLELYDDPVITDANRKQSMGRVNGLYNGISVSHSIPLKIYQNSWYSIVAETNWQCSNFLTEKTAKPIFSKKLFVVFGSQGLLQRLHKQGYKTFHGVIDESYDNEPDNVKRWSMAFEQVLKLATANHTEVYNEIEPILTHNHNHICDHHYRLNGLKNFFNQHLQFGDQ